MAFAAGLLIFLSRCQVLCPVNFLFNTLPTLRTRLLCVVVTMLTGMAGSLQAAEFQTLQVGYQGVGKVGKWLPLKSVVNGLPEGAVVELRALFSDPRGDTCLEIVDRADVGSGGSVSFLGYFKPGRLEGFGQIQVTLKENGSVLCQQGIAHGPAVEVTDGEVAIHSSLKLHELEVPFLMTFGDGPGSVAGIEELVRNADNFSQDHAVLHAVHLPSPLSLPATSRGLDAIDLLLITDNFETSPEQSAAVRDWVLKGGSLFVGTGATVPTFVKTEIGGWLSTRFGIRDEPINVRDLSPLQSFVPGSKVLRTNYDPVPLAVMKNDQTVEDVASVDGAIVGTQSVGAGSVTIVAVDLNQKPVSSWLSLPNFYEVLFFGEKFSRETTQESRSSRISQSGITDLATQMMATVDVVPETGRWSTWAVMTLVAGYLLLIGPVDYLLVTRLLKRPHMTWVTFPLMIVAGGTGLYMAAGAGDSRRLSQLDLIDVTQDGQFSHINAQTWMSLSSSDTMRGELAATIAIPTISGETGVVEPELLWSGRPEDIYGGMYRVGGIGLGRQSYTHDSAKKSLLEGVPLLSNGSRELFANWEYHSASPLISSSLYVSGYGLLNGTFSHNLPFSISDWMIVHGNRVYRSRETSEESRLAATDVWDPVAPEVYASDLKAFLNASRLVRQAGGKNDNRGVTQVVTPYDETSRDPLYILTMSTFYQLAGATQYVGLSNSLLSSVELSETIRRNHAVLIGVADSSATNLSVGETTLEATRAKTIVRILIPVDRRPASALAPKEDSN